MAMPKAITPDLEAKIVTLLRHGAPEGAVDRITGIAQSTISKCRIEHGIPVCDRKKWQGSQPGTRWEQINTDLINRILGVEDWKEERRKKK